MKKPEIAYRLIPEEKQTTHSYKTDSERTTEMRMAFMRGYLYGLLSEMENYLDWMTNRRKYNSEPLRWKWKIFFFKTFISNYRRRLHEMEHKLEKIKYAPPK